MGRSNVSSLIFAGQQCPNFKMQDRRRVHVASARAPTNASQLRVRARCFSGACALRRKPLCCCVACGLARAPCVFACVCVCVCVAVAGLCLCASHAWCKSLILFLFNRVCVRACLHARCAEQERVRFRRVCACARAVCIQLRVFACARACARAVPTRTCVLCACSRVLARACVFAHINCVFLCAHACARALGKTQLCLRVHALARARRATHCF